MELDYLMICWKFLRLELSAIHGRIYVVPRPPVLCINIWRRLLETTRKVMSDLSQFFTPATVSMEELKKILPTCPTRTATVTLTSWSSPRSSMADPLKNFTTRLTSPRSQSSNPQISTSLNRTIAHRLDLADRKIRAGKLQESMERVIVSAVRGFASSGSSASSTTFTKHLHASVGHNRSTNIPIDSAFIHESTTESTNCPNCTHVIVDKIVYDDPVCVTARNDAKTRIGIACPPTCHRFMGPS
ncbi:hypothetical protein TB2_028591 [Malus domestica]